MTRGSGRREFARLAGGGAKSDAGIPVTAGEARCDAYACAELWSVRGRGLAAGGVMITSSHIIQPQWNGVKYKASYGGSGLAVGLLKAIEGYLGDCRCLRQRRRVRHSRKWIFCRSDMCRRSSAFADLPKIKACGAPKFLIDSMYGAGAGGAGRGVFERAGVPFAWRCGRSINPAVSGD